MGMIKEFKEFALKGNLVDMAIGVVMGGAFGRVVSGFIDGLVMPLIGKLMGGVDFNNIYVSLSDAVSAAKMANPSLPLEEAKKLGAVLSVGSFITVLIDFIVVAFVVFMVIKALNASKKKEAEAAPAAPAGPSQEELLVQIRDLLKK
jgi:large conductance mechanosensitive channel